MSKRKHKAIEKIPVTNEENVARIIFSPSYLDGDKVSPTAFRWEYLPSGSAENYISVLREDKKYDFEKESRTFKNRKEGDTRWGYALLNVGDIRNLNQDIEGMDMAINVLPQPSPKMMNHAGIFVHLRDSLVTAATPLTGEIMFIQKQLASLCSTPIAFE